MLSCLPPSGPAGSCVGTTPPKRSGGASQCRVCLVPAAAMCGGISRALVGGSVRVGSPRAAARQLGSSGRTSFGNAQWRKLWWLSSNGAFLRGCCCLARTSGCCSPPRLWSTWACGGPCALLHFLLWIQAAAAAGSSTRNGWNGDHGSSPSMRPGGCRGRLLLCMPGRGVWLCCSSGPCWRGLPCCTAIPSPGLQAGTSP